MFEIPLCMFSILSTHCLCLQVTEGLFTIFFIVALYITMVFIQDLMSLLHVGVSGTSFTVAGPEF